MSDSGAAGWRSREVDSAAPSSIVTGLPSSAPPHPGNQGAVVLDLVIRRGTVVAPWGAAASDVAIQGTRIVAVAEPGTLAGDLLQARGDLTGGRLIGAQTTPPESLRGPAG
jgi:hypothetical protein